MSSMRRSSSTNRNLSESSSFSTSNLPWKPLCRCGDNAALRKARTVKNYGKLFWGCQHFKGHSNPGCGFFQWFYEECKGEIEQTLMNDQWKFEVLSEEMEEAKKQVEILRLNIMELEDTLKINIRWKKIWKFMFFCVLFVLAVKML
ncbi:uncharacterized protein LOC131647609 [Vicia villosa]|uniref:uncharacterized protein LOC131601912 n=1 Tax=Vicia villosa TaxID=3911 RepID=UPI00273B80FE|nr:uncharacterized protein LOC131601912 [Vicia villosa]XP_058735966.1 uncharacterized protein LOC131608041 [Vicia villosa]XP_058773466.1 uncharacterized protein LOC131647609 [Vicia villosa]